jgi:hypothetical protein
MTHLVEKYKINNSKELRIFHDECPLDPRTDYDNLGTMVCFHNRYDLGDKAGTEKRNKHNFTDPEELKSEIRNNSDIALALPLYLYAHSGITMNTSGFSCPWDSGQVGYLIAYKEDIRKWYGVKRLTKKILERAQECLEYEVILYDQYISGQVYRFEVIELISCATCQAVHENVIESCGSFFGYDFKENGLLDHALTVEEKEIVEKQL